MTKTVPNPFSLFAESGERKYLTDAEIRRFLAVAISAEPHVSLFCQCLAHTGCRLSEALLLNGYNIDPDNSVLVLPTLKQRKPGIHRQVPIPRQLAHDLVTYLHKGPNCPRLWPVQRQSAFRWLRPIWQAANLTGPKACSRGLRHGFAVGMAASGVPMPLIQRWMGHASLHTTAIYMDVHTAHQRGYAERRWERLQDDRGD